MELQKLVDHLICQLTEKIIGNYFDIFNHFSHFSSKYSENSKNICRFQLLKKNMLLFFITYLVEQNETFEDVPFSSANVS